MGPPGQLQTFPGKSALDLKGAKVLVTSAMNHHAKGGGGGKINQENSTSYLPS